MINLDLHLLSMCPRVLPVFSVAYPKMLGCEHFMDRIRFVSYSLGDGSCTKSYFLSVPLLLLRPTHGDTGQKTEFRLPRGQQMSSSQDHLSPASPFCSFPTVSGKAIPVPCQGSLSLLPDLTWCHQN